MDATQVMLASYDAALDYKWESLANALDGLDEAMSAWQPPAYANEPHDEGIGKPGTVLWFLNHLEFCHRHYAQILRTRPVEKQPETKLPGELPLARILPRLHETNAELRAQIERISPADIEGPCTSRSNVMNFVAALVRHIAWHSGQIMTVRRLYARR